LESNADLSRIFGDAAPFMKPLVPSNDALPSDTKDDESVQTKDSAPPPVAKTASMGQLVVATHDPALDEETATPTIAASKLSIGTMPTMMETAPPRTPAVQREAFRPAICR
jgi:hypothetical protein